MLFRFFFFLEEPRSLFAIFPLLGLYWPLTSTFSITWQSVSWSRAEAQSPFMGPFSLRCNLENVLVSFRCQLFRATALKFMLLSQKGTGPTCLNSHYPSSFRQTTVKMEKKRTRESWLRRRRSAGSRRTCRRGACR